MPDIGWTLLSAVLWLLSGFFLGTAVSSLYWNRQFRKLLREAREVNVLIGQLTARLRELDQKEQL